MKLTLGRTKKTWLRDRVKHIIYDWAPRLGLDAWLIHVSFRAKFNGAFAMMDARDPEYEQANIYVNAAKFAKSADAKELEYVILHEMVHIMLWDAMSSEGDAKDKAEETAVVRVARAFIRLAG